MLGYNHIKPFNSCYNKLNYFSVRKPNLNLDCNSLDVILFHQWITSPRGYYWMMQDYTEKMTFDYLSEFVLSKQHNSYFGLYKKKTKFYFEIYNILYDELNRHYKFLKGDVGLHIFIGPIEQKIHNFSYFVLRTIINFIFFHKNLKRIIVEPDHKNILAINLFQKMGFRKEKHIELLNKTALLMILNYEDIVF